MCLNFIVIDREIPAIPSLALGHDSEILIVPIFHVCFAHRDTHVASPPKESYSWAIVDNTPGL